MTTSKDPLLECPEWYEEAWQTGNYPIPDALKRAGYGEATSSRGIASCDDNNDNDSVNGNNSGEDDDGKNGAASNGVNGDACHDATNGDACHDATNGAQNQNGVAAKDDVTNGNN